MDPQGSVLVLWTTPRGYSRVLSKVSHFLGMLLGDTGSPTAPGNAGSGNMGAGCRNLEDRHLEEGLSDDQPSTRVTEIIC